MVDWIQLKDGRCKGTLDDKEHSHLVPPSTPTWGYLLQIQKNN